MQIQLASPCLPNVEKGKVLKTSPRVLLTHRELDFICPNFDDAYLVLKLWEEPAEEELAQAQAGICLGHQSPEAIVARRPSLGLLACSTSGYDGVHVASLKKRGIQVSHSPNASAEPVAEFALALLLGSYRNLVRGALRLREGEWVEGGVPLIG